MDVPGPAIVGLQTSERLKIVTINNIQNECSNTKRSTKVRDLEHTMQRYPKNFDTVGNFKGGEDLIIDDKVHSSIDGPRKFPIHIRDTLKAELDRRTSRSSGRSPSTLTGAQA